MILEFSEREEIKEYLLNKPCSYETRPFGELPICYRVAGKIFAQFSDKEDWYKVTLKTNPEAADFYRQAYPGIVVRGYHCPASQQPYWNTIELAGVDFATFSQMADEAYDEVVKGLTKKEQRKLPLRCAYTFTEAKQQDENFTLCVYKRKTLVGQGSYCFYDDETIRLKDLHINEDEQGLGVGRELLLRLEADARIKGYRYGIVGTSKFSDRAERLFSRNGYKQVLDADELKKKL